MCASYGLEISAEQVGDLFNLDERSVAGVAAWFDQFAADVVKPTGRIERKLNPIVRETDDGTAAELAWWGYLVGGEPAKFPSINTRSERLIDRPSGANSRVLIPASEWFEFEKPTKARWSFGTGAPFAMAGVAQRGRPTGGDPVTCYSIVMQPARDDLAHLHDRMPLLLPQSFFGDWLDPLTQGSPDLIEAALAAGREMTELVSARPAAGSAQLF